jgi:hypothetical protein
MLAVDSCSILRAISGLVPFLDVSMVLMKDVYAHNCLKRNDFCCYQGCYVCIVIGYCEGGDMYVWLWKFIPICTWNMYENSDLFDFFCLCRSDAIKKAKSNHFSEEVVKYSEFCDMAVLYPHILLTEICTFVVFIFFSSECRGFVCGLCSS